VDEHATHGAIVAFLALDGRADRLAAEHVDDGDGRCRCCTAGPQRGRVAWPCSLAMLAAQGRELAARDRHGDCG
jgi:hypothetical protein